MTKKEGPEKTAKTFETFRKDYGFSCLNEQSVDKDPVQQFSKWFSEIERANLIEPNAMILSTVGSDGRPSQRVVLLKEFSGGEFIFYSNYESKKGRELSTNPNASLLFYWAQVERQVRIEGIVEKLSAKLSDEYFNSRPRGAQVGALASPQSQALKDRAALDERYKTIDIENIGKTLRRPFNWGGYKLIPSYFEFWQGGVDRLHDRIVFEKHEATWQIGRLAP